jgi:hypothetical protein
MQKKILIALTLIAVIAIAIFALKKHEETRVFTPPLFIYTQPAGTSTMSTVGIDGSPVAEKAWATFLSYRQAVKNHDLSALMQVVYTVSDACKDPKQFTECKTRMDKAAEETKDFTRSEFKNVWYDNKQIILSTDWHVEQTDVALAEARKVIYFVIDSIGTPKVLFFTQPEELVYSFLDPNTTKEKLITRLQERIIDTDMDGISNEVETCTYQSADPKTCVKTDPNNKDSNGNGWWDSIEKYIK